MKKTILLIALLIGLIGCQSVCLGVINTTAIPERFSANGSVTTFTFTFRIVAQTDLTATVRTDATGVDTALTLNVDYTLAATNNDFGNGGVLTTIATYASGNTLILERDTERTQEVNLVQGRSLPAESTEQTFDKQTMAVQDIDKDLGFALTVPHGDPLAALTLELPDSVDRADEVLIFDATGNATTTAVVNIGTTVTEYMETLLDDETAADARNTLELGTTDAVQFAAITGTTGTFSGALSATTGTFSGAVSATTGTFSGAMVATTGTFSGLITANNGLTLGAGDDLIGSATSDITFNTDKFTVAGATGNTVIAGTLDVTGVTSLDDLAVKGPWADVKHPDFGAVGDGTTDDYTAITAAIATLADGGTLFFPPGQYMVKTSVVIPHTSKPIRVVGSGAASIRSQSPFRPATEIVTDQAIYCLTIGVTGEIFHGGPTIENMGFADVSASNDTALGGMFAWQPFQLRMMNCAARNFTVGSGFEFGPDQAAAQANYVMIFAPHIRNCLYGIRTGDSNSLIILGGQLNGKELANGIGVWAEEGADLHVQNVSIDEWVTGIELGTVSTVAGTTHLIGNRFEAVATCIDMIQASAGVATGNLFHTTVTTTFQIGSDNDNVNWYIYNNIHGDTTDAKIVNNLAATGAESQRNYIHEPRQEYYEQYINRIGIPDGDTDPNVGSGKWFSTANTSPTSITGFSGRLYEGKIIYVQINDSTAQTTFVHGDSTIFMLAGMDVTPLKRQTLIFIFDGVRWVQTGGPSGTSDEKRLSTTTGVAMGADNTKADLYTVPTGRTAIITKVVIRGLSGAVACGADNDFGAGSPSAGWKDTVNLSTLDGANDYWIVTSNDALIEAVFAAADVFGIQTDIQGDASAVTATIDVFGYLY